LILLSFLIMHYYIFLGFRLRNKTNSRFYSMPSQRFSSLRNAGNGVLAGKIANIVWGGGGGHGSGPLKRSRQRNGAVTRISLVMKAASIVHNSPPPPPPQLSFQKFLDPPVEMLFFRLNRGAKRKETVVTRFLVPSP